MGLSRMAAIAGTLVVTLSSIAITEPLTKEQLATILLMLNMPQEDEQLMEVPADIMGVVLATGPLAVSAPISPIFRYQFNYEIGNDGAGIEAEFRDSDGGAWPVQLSVQNEVLTVTSSLDLRFDTEYTLSLNGVVGGDNYTAEPLEASFRTRDRNTGFFLGAHVIDGLLDGIYGGPMSPSYFIETLRDNGIRNLRLGQTTVKNDALESNDQSSWAGIGFTEDVWSSRAITAETLSLLGSDHGGNNSVFLYFSSTSTHIYKYQTRNEWDQLSDEELLQAIEIHAMESAQFYADRGVAIHQFEIGNETDWGIGGFYIGEGGRLPDPPDDLWENREWQRTNLWSRHIAVINAAARGIRQVFPETKIVVHNVGFFQGENYTLDFYRHLIEQNTDFDVIGLSYPYLSSPADLEELYDEKPFFRGQKFHRMLRDISTLGKEIQLSEFQYHHDPEGTNITPSVDYPLTPQGQADFVTDMIDAWASYPLVSGVYYFYPDYYVGRCSCFADYAGFWANPFELQPVVNAMRLLDEKYNN